MARAHANGIEIEYDTFGDPGDPALLLVMGLTAQMTAWDEKFCQLLADRGRYVIRYDNRDVGLSTWFDGQDVDVVALMTARFSGGELPPVPYTLSDMAADGIGLLDALGIERAHVVGASMGGMIVQTMAIEHPERLLSMTSIMSMTGEPGYGDPKPEAIGALLAQPVADREGYVEQAVTNWKVFSAPRYWNETEIRRRAGEGYDRAFHPAGAPRQLGAIAASGSRSEALREVRVPTLVIHGRLDPLVTLSGGERTAELVPGASLLVLNDMAHDLPEPLWPLVVDAIVSHTTHTIR